MSVEMTTKNLVGRKYGKLTVTGLSNKKDYISYWDCVCECGGTKVVARNNLVKRNGSIKSCGCLRAESSRLSVKKLQGAGKDSPAWKSGRWIRDGYVEIWHPEHPNSNGSGYIREHRLVMSNIIGRPLTKEENVHHINGVRDDNRPENLELWNTSQPAGQRAEDKLKWAREIIALYE